jgi:hypothetical protein
MNNLSEPILFADNTSVIISSKNFDDFFTMSNTVLSHMSKWFTFNKVVLNLDNTNIIKFITNKSPQYDLNIAYNGNYIEESINTKFLGLQIDNQFPPPNIVIFTLQKRTVRIIAGVKSRNSCSNLFMRLEILPLPCEYIFTLMNFVANNQEIFRTKSAIHSVNTRNRDYLPRPTANISCFQKVHTILASKSSTVYHEI